jgi:hypothetical protein
MGEAVRMFDVLDLTSLGQNGRICSCLPQAVACGGCVRYGLESSWFLLPRSCGGGARDSRSQISKWPCANCLPTSPAAVCPSSSSKQGATPPAPQRKVAKQARQAHAVLRSTYTNTIKRTDQMATALSLPAPAPIIRERAATFLGKGSSWTMTGDRARRRSSDR